MVDDVAPAIHDPNGICGSTLPLTADQLRRGITHADLHSLPVHMADASGAKVNRSMVAWPPAAPSGKLGTGNTTVILLGADKAGNTADCTFHIVNQALGGSAPGSAVAATIGTWFHFSCCCCCCCQALNLLFLGHAFETVAT